MDTEGDSGDEEDPESMRGKHVVPDEYESPFELLQPEYMPGEEDPGPIPRELIGEDKNESLLEFLRSESMSGDLVVDENESLLEFLRPESMVGGDVVAEDENESRYKFLHPGRYVVMTVVRSFPDEPDSNVRVAVLDAPDPPPHHATAGMIVPRGRESDWIFCTPAGVLQLIHSCGAARLVLFGEPTSSTSPAPLYTRQPEGPDLRGRLRLLLHAFCPFTAYRGVETPETPFLDYEDGLVRCAVVVIASGPVVGEMVVEDVEVEHAGALDRRRRLRFKRTPNLVQTQMRLRDLPFGKGPAVDPEVLVQPYLASMVAGLLLLLPGPWVGSRAPRRRALCLGVGGGALLTFLAGRLAFRVRGVEADQTVLDLAKRYFGLGGGRHLRATLGDAMDTLRIFPRVPGAEVIMVDLDGSRPAAGVIAPPPAFAEEGVIACARDILLALGGVLVINVAPAWGPWYEELLGCLRRHFPDVYRMDGGEEENVVLFGASAHGRRPGVRAATEALRRVLGTDSYATAMRKI